MCVIAMVARSFTVSVPVGVVEYRIRLSVLSKRERRSRANRGKMRDRCPLVILAKFAVANGRRQNIELCGCKQT